MTLVVPFDASELARAALVRATEFAAVFEEDVVAVSVVPKNNVEYAREKGWLDSGEPYDRQSVLSTLHEAVTDLAPSADFRHEFVGRYAPTGEIAKRLRKFAREEDASMVFVGSENAGHVATTLSSVGGSVVRGDAYDVVLVRHRRPPKVEELRERSPHRRSKSDFYLPG